MVSPVTDEVECSSFCLYFFGHQVLIAAVIAEVIFEACTMYIPMDNGSTLSVQYSMLHILNLFQCWWDIFSQQIKMFHMLCAYECSTLELLRQCAV